MNIDFLYGNQLFSYYGMLLTEHQRSVLQEFYEDDYSMQEIAENFNISKAAVSDLISRCNKQLVNYEKKLGLIRKDSTRNQILQEMSRSEDPEVRLFYAKLNQLEEEL